MKYKIMERSVSKADPEEQAAGYWAVLVGSVSGKYVALLSEIVGLALQSPEAVYNAPKELTVTLPLEFRKVHTVRLILLLSI
jgi:hypothetical protein